jgi:hypothetical protein
MFQRYQAEAKAAATFENTGVRDPSPMSVDDQSLDNEIAGPSNPGKPVTNRKGSPMQIGR